MPSGGTPGPDPSVTDEELLAVFHETDDPVLSTAEVAEAVPLERRSVYDRLVSLRDDSRLASKQIGGRNTVWWLPESEENVSLNRAAEIAGYSPEEFKELLRERGIDRDIGFLDEDERGERLDGL